MATQAKEPFVLDFQNGQQVEDILKKAQGMANIRAIGDGLSLDANGKLSASGGASGDSYTKAEIDALLDGKVDVVSGKGLSTNDFTDADKTKLTNLENYDDTEVKASIASLQNVADETAQEVEDARGTYASLGERLDDMSGGGGGTSDYSKLTNKPTINGVELDGDQTTSSLGIKEVTPSVDDENLIFSIS